MSASAENRFESGPRAVIAAGVRREGATGWAPVLTPCLRATPQSPLPSDFERAVMDTAAHARYDGRCEAMLRARCRVCALGGASLLAIALLLAISLPTPWLGALPAALAGLAGWRWAVLSAAADELRTESGG